MPLSEHSFFKKTWNPQVRSGIYLVCCSGMIGGMLFSRAMVSISMILMVANTLHPESLQEGARNWRRSSFAKWCLAFVGAYLISGFWSEDLGYWAQTWKGKIPFIVLPFAFFAVPLYDEVFRRRLTLAVTALLMACMLYSLGLFLSDVDYYLAELAASHPIPTTAYGDHIRFSLSIVLAMLMAFFQLFEPAERKAGKATRIFLIVYCFLSFGYLHVLAAKTGLLALYLMLGLYLLIKISARNKWWGIATLVVTPLIASVAFFTIPTFKTKIEYVQLEVEQYRRDHRFDYNYSDNGRMISYELALHLIARQPLTGTGAGDLRHKMDSAYARFYPEVPQVNRLVPHNQFLFTATATGLVLVLGLIGMVLAPFFVKGPYRSYLIINNIVLLSAMMVEAMIEVQFGVLTYLFFTMFWLSSARLQNKKA